jgi:signal transduction histidine kinase
MEQFQTSLDSSTNGANSVSPEKPRPRLIRQLVLSYGISAGLILITLIAQRTGMPILSQQYQEGMEHIWMLRLTVEELENALTTQENGLRAYVMSGQPEFLESLTNGRRQYLTYFQQAQTFTTQIGDDAVKAGLNRMNQLTEQWYHAYGQPLAAHPSGDAVRHQAISWEAMKRDFDRLRQAFDDLENTTNTTAQQIEEKLNRRRRNFLIIACSGYVIGLLIGLFALVRSTRHLRQPLESLITSARRVGQGDFSIRASGDPYAETVAVAQAFNRMAGEIAAQRQETEGLLQSLRQKHIELEEEHRQVEQANQFKSQFLANITHDLRTPLSSMVLYTDMLLKGKMGSLTPSQRDALQTILRRGNEQLRLVNELLDASRLDAKQLSLQRAPVSLADVMEQAFIVAQPLAEAKQLQLVCEWPSEPVIVEADRLRLLQVFNNLLENAVKFTPAEGQIHITVTPTVEQVEVAITNTGDGIDPQDLPFIFDRFYRGRQANLNDASGSGLGLYITKELVELHGGSLRATSNGRHHTTFSFTLPRQPAIMPVPAFDVVVS